MTTPTKPSAGTCDGTPGEPGYIVTSETCQNCGHENDMDCPGCEQCHADCTRCGGTGEVTYTELDEDNRNFYDATIKCLTYRSPE